MPGLGSALGQAQEGFILPLLSEVPSYGLDCLLAALELPFGLLLVVGDSHSQFTRRGRFLQAIVVRVLAFYQNSG